MLVSLLAVAYAPNTRLPVFSTRSLALPAPPIAGSAAMPAAARRCLAHSRMVETTDTTTDAVAAMPTAASDTADTNRVRTVCVALLGQLSKLEDELKEKELDYEGFSDLIDELEVACDESWPISW